MCNINEKFNELSIGLQDFRRFRLEQTSKEGRNREFETLSSILFRDFDSVSGYAKK